MFTACPPTLLDLSVLRVGTRKVAITGPQHSSISYRFPRLKGVKEEPDPTTAEGFEDPALLPGGTDDLADEDPIEQIGDKLLSRGPKGEAEVESREDYEDSLYQPSGDEEEDEHEHGHGVRAAKVEEEHLWETVRCDYEAPSDLARLVFCVPLHNNRGAEVLDALQQVYIELRSLNLPVLRFHTDRGREFCNAKVRAWFHHRGVRTTTREANAPQQNGPQSKPSGGLRLVLVLSSARRKPGLSCGRAQWLLQQPSNVPNSLV